ncbi:BolA family protein [Fastidiosibacter lacustris]|uniref:BolA family protein n=1 Tax=Fastidiosibacter lacustris TaxID=2056695 RepID=UPI000E34D2DF|nr:BolA family protein [Fastidiosibacter lacustris]
MNTNSNLQKLIIDRLTKAFDPSILELIDETHKHQKHKHFQSGKFHFKLRIASLKFVTLSTIKAHQEIYTCLGDLMKDQIHALSIHIENN